MRISDSKKGVRRAKGVIRSVQEGKIRLLGRRHQSGSFQPQLIFISKLFIKDICCRLRGCRSPTDWFNHPHWYLPTALSPEVRLRMGGDPFETSSPGAHSQLYVHLSLCRTADTFPRVIPWLSPGPSGKPKSRIPQNQQCHLRWCRSPSLSPRAKLQWGSSQDCS